ncbi:MAG: hypothetical protein CME32_31885 [Gimesia sp.]|nr:hypothetical protein [Gimesia sp.]
MRTPKSSLRSTARSSAGLWTDCSETTGLCEGRPGRPADVKLHGVVVDAKRGDGVLIIITAGVLINRLVVEE